MNCFRPICRALLGKVGLIPGCQRSPFHLWVGTLGWTLQKLCKFRAGNSFRTLEPLCSGRHDEAFQFCVPQRGGMANCGQPCMAKQAKQPRHQTWGKEQWGGGKGVAAGESCTVCGQVSKRHLLFSVGEGGFVDGSGELQLRHHTMRTWLIRSHVYVRSGRLD